MLKRGPRHNFSVRLNAQHHEDWMLMVQGCGLFHLKIDVEMRTQGLIVYVAYIGPKCFAKDYIYEVGFLILYSDSEPWEQNYILQSVLYIKCGFVIRT